MTTEHEGPDVNRTPSDTAGAEPVVEAAAPEHSSTPEPAAPAAAATSVGTGLRATDDAPAVAAMPVVEAEPTAAEQQQAIAQAQAQGVDLAPIGHGPDRAFRGAAYAAAFFIVGLVVFVGAFLAWVAVPSLAANKENFFTSTSWQVSGGELAFGIAGLLWTTVLSSVVAMILAVPVAVGTALLVTQYLKPRVGNVIGFLIDLLAAVPSIVFGLWGLKLLGPALAPFYAWLERTLGWIPIFGPGVSSTGNVMTASIVLAIMILPIVSAMSRDVFVQTPRDHVEAALALGATKWEMIRTAVIPYGRSGVVAASMLGLGRALGETVAVMIILSTTNDPGINVSLFAGGETFASKIANNAAEFDTPSKTGAYIAAGLVLFVVTFAVNAIARVIADRKKTK